MRVVLNIQSRSMNAPEFALWNNLANVDLTAHFDAGRNTDFVLTNYVGIPGYDVRRMSVLISAMLVVLSTSENTSQLEANYVGRFEEYRVKLTA